MHIERPFADGDLHILRQALTHGPLDRHALLRRLCGMGLMQGEADGLVRTATARGLIVASYRLTAAGKAQARPVTSPPAPSQASATHAYEGPVFDLAAPLTPSIGTRIGLSAEEAEGELPPCVGARIRDHLGQQFDRMFGPLSRVE